MGNTATKPSKEFELHATPLDNLYEVSQFQRDVRLYLRTYYINKLEPGKRPQNWAAKEARQAAFEKIRNAFLEAIEKKCDNILASAIEKSNKDYRAYRGSNGKSNFHDILSGFAHRFREERDGYGIHLDEIELAEYVSYSRAEQPIIEQDGKTRRPKLLEIIERKDRVIQGLNVEISHLNEQNQQLERKLVDTQTKLVGSQQKLAEAQTKLAESLHVIAETNHQQKRYETIFNETVKKLTENVEKQQGQIDLLTSANEKLQGEVELLKKAKQEAPLEQGSSSGVRL